MILGCFITIPQKDIDDLKKRCTTLVTDEEVARDLALLSFEGRDMPYEVRVKV